MLPQEGAPNEVANPAMLILARESRGLTQTELARRLSVTQGTVSKAETGLTLPSAELVAKYAHELQYTEGFFYRRADKRSLPITFHRKRKTLAAGVVRRVEADVNIKRLQLQTLLLSAEVPECQIPAVDLGPETSFDPRQVARDLRVHLRTPRGPIENMTALLEDHGVLVLRCDFGTTHIDGISLFDRRDGLPPVVFVNAELCGERLRFTLAHELAHMVLHHHLPIPPMDCEVEADDFASEFLMPASDIRPFLTRVNLESIFSLKRHWKVSASALIMRAAELDKISPRTKQRFFIQMSAQGIRNPEPVPIPREEPTLLPELVQFHYTIGYSDDDLSAALGIYVDEFRSQYLPEEKRAGLRLVRSL